MANVEIHHRFQCLNGGEYLVSKGLKRYLLERWDDEVGTWRHIGTFDTEEEAYRTAHHDGDIGADMQTGASEP